MSNPLTKQQLVRAEWLRRLRTEGHRQCRGELRDGGGRVCALGLLAEVAQLEFAGMEIERVAGECAGLDSVLVARVVKLNDGGKGPPRSFREIADRVESWFA